MSDDVRAAQAREFNRRAQSAGEDARRARQARDELIRQLRHEDPGVWTYRRLARAVGVSEELIAVVVRVPTRRSPVKGAVNGEGNGDVTPPRWQAKPGSRPVTSRRNPLT